MIPDEDVRCADRCGRVATDERLYALGVDGSEQVDLVCSCHATHPEEVAADV